MVWVRGCLLALWALLVPGLVWAQDYKPVNKPGKILSNVTTEDQQKAALKFRKGEKVTVVYARDEWLWVQNKKGKGGWVLKKEVKVSDPGAAAEAKRKRAEERAARKAAAAEAKRKKAEERAARRAAAEEAKRKKKEEAQAAKAEAEAAKTNKNEEAEAAALAEQERLAAEEAARQAAEQQAAEEEAARKAAAEQQAAAAAEAKPAKPQLAMAPVHATMEPVVPAVVPMAAGYLSVRASEAGAAVLLDGRRVGDAPLRVEVEGGRHQVTVVKDDFAPAVQEVEVNGNEVNVALALAPGADLIQKHRTGVFVKWGAGFGVIAAGGAAAVLFAAVGMGGALLWIASAVANVTDRAGANVTYSDPVSSAAAPVLANPAFTLVGAGITFAGPLLALALAAAGALGGGLVLLTAGDPGRYNAYQE